MAGLGGMLENVYGATVNAASNAMTKVAKVGKGMVKSGSVGEALSKLTAPSDTDVAARNADNAQLMAKGMKLTPQGNITKNTNIYGLRSDASGKEVPEP